MPSGRKRSATTTSPADGDTTAEGGGGPPKWRRVSRACDPCRVVKEKCDGVKPGCRRCEETNRQCTYAAPEKRRGVRTGYLRGVELALAFVLDRDPECETLLLEALAEQPERPDRDNDGNADTDESSPSPPAATERLLKKWQQSQLHRHIDRLVLLRGDDFYDRNRRAHDDEPEPAPATELAGISPPLQDRGQSVLLGLPPNAEQLLELYFASIHGWLPVVSPTSLGDLASFHPAGGVLNGPQTNSTSRDHTTLAMHAELWSVMAVAQTTFDPGGHAAAPIYNAARRLIPLEEHTDIFEMSHVRSLLLLSVARLNLREAKAAWLLTGKAVRILLQLLKKHHHQAKHQPQQPRQVQQLDDQQVEVLFMACFTLDTLVSLTLGHPPNLRASDLQQLNLGGFASRPLHSHATDSSPRIDASASSETTALHQQFKFAIVLSQHTGSNSADWERGGRGYNSLNKSRSRNAVADLVQSLDPPFRFCNALVSGGLDKPRNPAAVLVHAAFLASSILLSPPSDTSSRRRLIDSLADVADQCLSSFGADLAGRGCGGPPYPPPVLLSLYLNLILQPNAEDGQLQPSGSRDDEQHKLARLLGRSVAVKGLVGDGQSPGADDVLMTLSPTTASTIATPYQPQPIIGTPTTVDMHTQASSTLFSSISEDFDQSQGVQLGGQGGPALQRGRLGGSTTAWRQHVHHSAPVPTPPAPITRFLTSTMTNGNHMLGNPVLMVDGTSGTSVTTSAASAVAVAGSHGASVGDYASLGDYDAILDELSSLDYVDSMELEPQFMANLGFAPGETGSAELQDMFGEHYFNFMPP